MQSKSRFKRFGIVIMGAVCLLGACGSAWCVEEDSAVARNLYTKPLTHRETPPGYRNKPMQYTPEPIGFRDNPLNWSLQPMGYREKPIPQLDEPRNGSENPFTFVSREAIPVANLDEKLKTSRDQHPSFNGDPDLKIVTTGYEETALQTEVAPRNPGYKGINPPSKARLQNFQ